MSQLKVETMFKVIIQQQRVKNIHFAFNKSMYNTLKCTSIRQLLILRLGLLTFLCVVYDYMGEMLTRF